MMPHDLTPADLEGPSSEERAKHVLDNPHILRAWGLEPLVAEAIRQAEQAAREKAQSKFVTALAKIYLHDGCSLPVSEVCDEYLDQSGAMLGEVRDEAMRLRALKDRSLSSL